MFLTVFVICSLGCAAEQKPPLAPAEILAGFKRPADLKIELVASEPQVQSPVAMTFDAQGRPFVVEMLDYPNPVKGAPPAGRIRMLSNPDASGVYQTATLYADNLLMANGLAAWRDGFVVTSAPNIYYLKDTKNAGQADQRDILYEGFAVRNPQLRCSHPTLGIDNWFYVTNGAQNGVIKNTKGGPGVDINGLDFRFNPIDQRYEAVSGIAQFGFAFDDWGRRFECSNRNHLVEIVMENRYFARNPYLVAPPPKRDDQRPGGSAKIYPISGNKTLAANHIGSFTAACGVTIFRGGALPKEYEGNIYTCEPTGNLIHREILTQNGSTFANKPATEGVEFLASPSHWFRPVSMTSGPDGALYVIDFCRSEVEHPDWVPASLQHRYDFNGNRGYGRIWRITAKDAKSKPAPMKLDNASDLLDHLASEHVWERATAQRLLLEGWKPEWADALKKRAEDAANPRAQVLALWLLKAQKSLGADTVTKALASAHPRVRENAAQVAEDLLANSTDIQKSLTALATDTDPRVRFQAALSLGYWNDDSILEPLASIAAKDGADRWTRLAICSSVAERSGKLLARCLERCDHPDLFAEISGVIGSRKNSDEIAALITLIEKQPGGKVSAVLDGLSSGLKRRGSSLQKFVAAIGKPELNASLEHLLSTAVAQAADEKLPAAIRERAIALAPQLPEARSLALLLPLLHPSTTDSVRAATIAAVGTINSRDASDALLAQWKGSLPAVRTLLLQALTPRPIHASVLLDGIEKNTIAASELGGTAQRQLTTLNDKSVAERAKKILKTTTHSDRAAVIERYRPALPSGDIARGKDVFAKNCVACHRINGVGNVVGPDISDTLSKDPLTLLTDILDPNKAIDTNYVTYSVKTKAGVVASGLIATKTASSVTLRRDNSQEETFLMEDVSSIQSTGKSLMPEGLEATITPEQMADLIAYLKNWRDL